MPTFLFPPHQHIISLSAHAFDVHGEARNALEECLHAHLNCHFSWRFGSYASKVVEVFVTHQPPDWEHVSHSVIVEYLRHVTQDDCRVFVSEMEAARDAFNAYVALRQL